MNSLIVGLPLILFICISDSGASPTPFRVVRYPFTRLPADNNRAVPLSPSLLLNFTASRQYTRDLSNSRDELQPIPNAFFPTYGIVLLVLFIIICALSSVLAMITMHSRTTREWIGMVPGRVYARVTGRRQGSGIQEDSHDSQRGGSKGKNPCYSPFDLSSVNRDPSSPYTISPEPKNKPEVTASEETMAIIPDAPFSVSVHSPLPSGKVRSVVTNPLPQCDPAHDRLFLHLSPILDFQTLLSASKRMFQFLTSGLTSRSSTPQSSTPNIVTVDVSVPTPPESDVISLPSAKTSDLDSTNIMIVEGDVGCQSLALSTPPAVTAITQSPLPHSDQCTSHSPTSTRSMTGFYSLSGDAQLSASTAFHSFIDLSMFATSGDTVSDTITVNPSDVKNTVVLSPRYIHGIQLETIQEESDAVDTSLDLVPSTSVVRDHSHLGDMSISSGSHDIPVSLSEVEMNTVDNARSDSTKFTEQMLSSRGEHVHEAPRFFPAARPPPPPSEPFSTVVQVISALRSPERQDKRRSVAWLQPVIDWAVDYPLDDCDCNPNKTLDSIPDMESDAECADALHAADAMAAVMDSLAAIGMDPTDMGLVTGEAISSTLSSFHSTSPSFPFADSEACHPSLHARIGEADLIEEQEVEDEIGTSSNLPSQQFYHQSSAFSREAHLTTTPVHNRSAYQDQQQGESIKTALISLLSPSSSRISTGEIQFDAQELSNVPTSPARDSQIGRKTTVRDAGRINSENISARVQQIHGDSKTDVGRARSPATSRPVTRTPRSVQQGRVYASPSSLAGLSPLEVAKKFSNTSVSSAGSTPSPSGTRAASPQHRPSSVSPMQLRRKRAITNSPSFDCTVSTMSSSSRHDPASPFSHSPTPISHRQHWQQHTSELGCTKSTPILSLRNDGGFLTQFTSSPISLLQRQKPSAVSGLAHPGPILNERTNSMEFESM